MSVRYRVLGLVACSAACGGPASPLRAASPSPALSPAPASVPGTQQNAAPLSAVGASTEAPVGPRPEPLATLQVESFALPGAVGAVSLDYIFYEPLKSRVWVPAGGTGRVAVFDTLTRTFSAVDGFKIAEREGHGKKRVVGPSAGAIGDRFAYIGNRATQEICPVDLTTLKSNRCLMLSARTDGVAYVAATREVWVTTPETASLAVLDASQPGALKQKTTIVLPGRPEGYAVDEPRGLFFTNLEDKGSTLAIDLKTHAVKETWNAGCSSEGPRGIAVDSGRNLALVACTDHVQALDMAHGGALLGQLDTGEGVDNIDYVAATGLLYVAAGKAARLTLAHVGERGDFKVIAKGETAAGARNAVADGNGVGYVADPQGRLLVLRTRR